MKRTLLSCSIYFIIIIVTCCSPWPYILDSWTTGNPVIGLDGTIYIGSEHELYAINPDCSLKWKFAAGNYYGSSPAIETDGTIYMNSKDKYFYAIKSDGTLKWKYWLSDDFYYVIYTPLINNDGAIYITARNNHIINAFNPDGTIKWVYSIEGDQYYDYHSNLGLAPDGTIYVVNSNLNALNPDGTLKWVYKINNSTSDVILTETPPVIGPDNIIYFHSADFLCAVYPDGTEKWRRYLNPNVIWHSPTVSNDNTIYICAYGPSAPSSENAVSNFLYALTSDNIIKWKYTAEILISNEVVIGSDNAIYITEPGGKVYALNPDSTLKWSCRLPCMDDKYPCMQLLAPVIGTDGTIYVTTRGREIYAINPEGTYKKISR